MAHNCLVQSFDLSKLYDIKNTLHKPKSPLKNKLGEYGCTQGSYLLIIISQDMFVINKQCGSNMCESTVVNNNNNNLEDQTRPISLLPTIYLQIKKPLSNVLTKSKTHYPMF